MTNDMRKKVKMFDELTTNTTPFGRSIRQAYWTNTYTYVSLQCIMSVGIMSGPPLVPEGGEYIRRKVDVEEV